MKKTSSGMTLIEMLVAMTVFSVVMAGAFAVLRSESGGMRLGAERADALQNIRFTANLLELDLRTLGSNVPDEQPFLIYAGSDVVAFNADYTSNVDDPYAVYYDPDAPTGSVTALTADRAFTFPNTSFSYPDTSYSGGGGVLNSPAETIIFFFTPDSSTARTDDYGLFRQVNTDPPELVGRDILQTPGMPFFQYYRVQSPQSAPAYVEELPDSALPITHWVPAHGAPGDTAGAALIDSIRGMRVNLTVTNGRTGDAEHTRALSRLIRLPNAGLAVKKSCGDEPLLGIVTFLATPGVNAALDPIITLTWTSATDEASGEEDVTRYVIWRRITGDPDWGDPYLSIPPGNTTYTYTDEAVTAGTSYDYALAAQDCTPSLSQLALAGPVVP
jgi:prepilin-type N-terminal cleavage/methylation domain-containing protein